jgi:translation initiation factor IF-2
MDKASIDAARAQAGQAVIILTPILQALQSANEVLSLASNVEKSRAIMAGELKDLENQAITLHESIAALQVQKADLQAEVAKAELEAKALAKAATQAAQEKVKAAEAAATARAAAAEKAAAEKEAAFTQHIQDVQRNTDAEVAALFTRQQTAAEAAEAAEAKLAKVREQAQKFAASLGG